MQVKRINDYYDELYERFPDVPKKDIVKILQYGWKSIYLHNVYGGDTLVKDNGFFFYIGRLYKDSLKHFKYYIDKMSIRIRVMFKRRKIEWDGYYYFALNDKRYEDYLSQKNKKGRKRKHFKFGDVYLYKIFDECKIKERYRRYIFRTKLPLEFGFTHFIKDYKTDAAELVLIREYPKFSDILLENNNYKYIFK